MSELTRLSEHKTHETKGGNIQQANPFFRDLCSIMKNKEFRQFYDEYFHSWNDVECMIFYMHLFASIEHEYRQRYTRDISDELMTYTLHEIMTTTELRKTAFELFKNYENDFTVSKSKPLRSLLKFARK